MKRYYVYELYNSMGTVEYVGETTRPEARLYQHTKVKPNNNHTQGKFYNRQDISMNIVAEFNDRKDALKLEGILKLQYNIEWAERLRQKNNRKLTNVQVQEIFEYLNQGLSQRKIAKQFNVSQAIISQIVNNILYKDITLETKKGNLIRVPFF